VARIERHVHRARGEQQQTRQKSRKHPGSVAAEFGCSKDSRYVTMLALVLSGEAALRIGN
jgi:hypothetical protein